MITDQSQTAQRLHVPLITQDLSPAQRCVVELMQKHQFGRIENIPVRDGQPVLDRNMKAVQVARFGGENTTNQVASEEYELKRPVRDLFDRLARLDNGTGIRLEFRNGLPFLLETTATASS
jgi:hypothetical protein